MAKMKRRLTKRELNDYYKIEELIQSTKQQDNQRNKPELIETVKEAQQVKKEIAPIQYLKCNHKQIKVSDIRVSDHAYERSIERFSLQYTKKDEVEKYLHKHLAEAEYIGRVRSTDGNEGEMFVKDKFCFQLSPDSLDTIITVVKIENKMKQIPAQEKVKRLIFKEFRKLHRTECARIRQLNEYKLESEVEISNLKLRKYRTKSDAVKMSCTARIKAVQMRLNELESEIDTLRDSKRKTAYALASVI